MKKFIMAILVAAMMICGAVGIAACEKDKKPDDSGQIDQSQTQDQEDKDKDKEDGEKKDPEEENPGDSKDPNATNPPETPENQKPGEQPGETNPGEKDPEGGSEDPTEKPDEKNPEGDPEKEPEGDSDEKDPEGEPGENEPDEPEGPNDKPEDEKDPEDKPEEDPEDPPQQDEPGDDPVDPPQKEDPVDPPKKDDPIQENCDHKWTYPEAHGTDPNNAKHVALCSLCGKRVSENCTWGDKKYVEHEPTCTEDGYKEYTCQVCGHSLKTFYYLYGIQQKKATGHSFTDFKHVANSSPSAHEKTCSKCGEKETQNCTFDKAIKQPTCDQPGVNSHTCTVCQYTETLVGSNEALGHDWKYEKSINSGYSHRKTCTRCGKAENELCQKETTTVEATCTTAGSVTKTCKSCGWSSTTATPAGSGHQVEEATQDGEKITRSSKGHSGKCKLCGQNVEVPHKYNGVSNCCTVCGWDEMNPDKYGIIPGGRGNEISSRFNGGNLKYSIIILSDYYMDLEGYPLTTISKGAFAENSKVEVIYFPASVKTIESGAFKNCTGLKRVLFGGKQEDVKTVESAIKSEIGESSNIKFEYEKKPEDALKGESNAISTAQPVALPAQVGKRYA